MNKKYVLDKGFKDLEKAKQAVIEARAKYMPFSKEHETLKINKKGVA